MQNLTALIARHILTVGYDSLSDQTVSMTKQVFLDALGAMLAGSSAPGIPALVDLVKGWGGKEEGTIAVFSGRVPAHHAVLVNCTMARARELDDVYEAGGGHPGATFVPASLVIAEYLQRRVSGKDLILGIATGADLSIRLLKAIPGFPGWLGETVAPFGVVAMASQMLNFDEDHLLNALGLAYSQCSTNSQTHVEGTLATRLQQGLGAQAGVLATVLSQHGFTGPRDVFQGTYGFYPLYARNHYMPDVITNDLGRHFEIVDTSFKLYPCCKLTHIPILLTSQLMSEHKIETQDLRSISVFTNTISYDQTGKGENKYRPRSVVDAQFSIPYVVAVAATRGTVFIDDFVDLRLQDGEVLDVARKVKVVVDPEIDRMPGHVVGSRVEIETMDGQRYARYLESMKGSPQNPMTMDETVAKFRECNRYAASPMGDDRIENIVALVTHLDELKDVRRIAELLD